MDKSPRQQVRDFIHLFKQHIKFLFTQGETSTLFYSSTLASIPATLKNSLSDSLPPSPPFSPNPIPQQPEFKKLAEAIGQCLACPLAQTRKQVVVGEGDISAQLVFVGEAPGVDEDRQGKPFVGAAGQLLTKIIESIGLKREQVYICNVLKCRPPGNRNPLPLEIQACEPFLKRQLSLLQPKIICALGTFAAQTLLLTHAPISQLRGKIYAYQAIPLVPTLHPAALLYHPQNKRLVWEDMKKIAQLLGLPAKKQ